VQADPGKRYQGAAEALEALNALETLESIEPGGRSGSTLKTIIGTVAGSLLRRDRDSLRKELDSFRKERSSVWREGINPGRGLIGTVVIAVGGASRGTGCTHTAIAAAAFLAGKGFKTALLELNENPVYYTIQEEYRKQGCWKGRSGTAGWIFTVRARRAAMIC